MKKLSMLLLVAVMSISIVACGSEPQTNGNGSQQETEQNTEQVENESGVEADTSEAETSVSEESNEPEEPEVLIAFDGKSPKIPSADFPNYLEVVEMTAENWKDYFEVVYDEEWKSYDLLCKAPIYDMTNLTLELKVIKEESPVNGQTKDPKVGALITEYESKEGFEYTINDFECANVQGELIIVNIPDELWGTYGDDIVVYIGSNNGEQWLIKGRETSLGKFID